MMSFYAEIARKLLLGPPKLGLCGVLDGARHAAQEGATGQAIAVLIVGAVPEGVFAANASQSAARPHFPTRLRGYLPQRICQAADFYGAAAKRFAARSEP